MVHEEPAVTEQVHVCPHCRRVAKFHNDTVWGPTSPHHEAHVRRCEGASARERAFYRHRGTWPRGQKELKQADGCLARELADESEPV